MGTKCDCNEPVEKGSALDAITRGVARRLAKYCSEHGCAQSEALDQLDRHPLTRSTSRVVAARVTDHTANQVQLTADALGISRGKFIRLALESLAKGQDAKDPESILGELAAALGIDPHSSPTDILSAVEALVASLEASTAPDAATAEAADPAPGMRGLGKDQPRALTKAELAACKARGLDPAVYAHRRATMVRSAASARPVAACVPRALSANDRAACAKAGITPEEFQRRRERLVRRA